MLAVMLHLTYPDIVWFVFLAALKDYSLPRLPTHLYSSGCARSFLFTRVTVVRLLKS